MRRSLYYAFVVSSSYLTGVLIYLAYLSLYYRQGIGGEWDKFLWWTLPPYMLIVLPCYIIAYRLLRTKKAAFVLQAFVFIALGLFGVMAVPSLAGLGMWRAGDLISSEVWLFFLFFTGTALSFAYGCQVARKGRGYAVYIPVSVVIAALAIGMLAREAEQSRPVIHQIPQGLHGKVEIHYGVAGYPLILEERGYYVIRIPDSGVYKTSSERPFRGTRRVLVDDQGKEIREIRITSESSSFSGLTGVTVDRYEVP